MVAPLLVEAGLSTKYRLETRREYLRAVVGLLKERVRRLPDFVAYGAYFFSFDYRYDQSAEQKQFTHENADLLEELADRFEALPELTGENTERTLSDLAQERGFKKAQLIHPARLAVTGTPVGPGLYDILAVLGKQEVVERMRKAVKYIRTPKTVK
jgi:glutamyl/glutaminyl-tRNA synthetase